MSEEMSAGCQRPAGSPLDAKVPDTDMSVEEEIRQNSSIYVKEKTMIQVGKKAPDFTAPGFHNNAFVNVTLSEHLGKWVVLCFYPGDFTFV